MSGTVISSDGVCWNRTAVGQLLLTDADLALPSHIDSGRAAVVKHGAHRTVYRVTLPTGVIYWKHCRLNGPRAWIREIFRGPKAKLEFDRAQAIAARGIETIEPLAWGAYAGRWPRGSVLITRALAGTLPLDEYLLHQPPTTAAARRAMSVALAAYVGRLHAAGITHPDLHPGNLLVRNEPGGPQFILIDVHDVRLGRPLSGRAARANLVLLNRWFQLRTSRTDRLRFWRAYSGGIAGASELEVQTARSTARLWRSRDGRCLRPNRSFCRATGPMCKGFAVRDIDPAFLAELTADPDAPFANPTATILKNSRSSTVCELTAPTPAGPRPMIFKRFRVTDWYDPFTNLLRPSPALRSWKRGHALLDRGLPTPRPVLVLHRSRFGLAAEGYLLCEKIPAAVHLHEKNRDVDFRVRRSMIDALAGLIRRMHERLITHRDLKAANILVTGNADSLSFHLIDLVGVRTHRWVSRRIRVRDLTRLNASFLASPKVTRTDRLRFLRVYLLWGLHGRGEWKDWWKKIEKATAAKVRQNERRQRPLA